MPRKKKNAKPQRGGTRPGAGRKNNEDIGKEKKINATIRLFPSQKEAIINKYGSIQKGIDSVFNAEFIDQNKLE